jgi:hypothetical protein
MKPAYSFNLVIGCIFIIALSMSCKKDSPYTSSTICDTCKVREQPTFSVSIVDSNWVRQSNGVYISYLNDLLQQAGASIAQIYSIHIINDADDQQIFLNSSIAFEGGHLGLSDPGNSYQLEFHMDQPTYYGETPHSIPLPFHSVIIKIFLLK